MGCKMRVETARLAEQVESVLASATNSGHFYVCIEHLLSNLAMLRHHYISMAIAMPFVVSAFSSLAE